jgi:transposase
MASYPIECRRIWADRKARLGGYVRLSMSDRREAVKELANDGHSNREIATVIGVDESTVREDKRAGNPARQNGKQSKPHDAEGDTAGNPAPAEASKLDEAVRKVFNELYDRRNCEARHKISVRPP